MSYSYDVMIIGAGPGGIFSAYELLQKKPEWKIVVLEAGNSLDKRKCSRQWKDIPYSWSDRINCENDHFTESYLQIRGNPNPNLILHIEKNNKCPKIYMEQQKTSDRDRN